MFGKVTIFLSILELYTVTMLTETAMMGADIDGDVLVYLDMAQVILMFLYGDIYLF